MFLIAIPAMGSADTVFIYSSVNNLYGVNLSTQQETYLTTASLSPAVNALASNSTDGLVYYGDNSSIYYWDPALGTGANAHALINNFENGFFQAPIHNINSTGGSFLDGRYYLGSETDNGFIEDVYVLEMSADGRQMVSVQALDIHSACNCTEVQLGGFGDIAVVNEGGGPVMYGSSADLTGTGQGTHAGIWRFDLTSNTWALLGNGNGGQVANSLDGRVYTNIGNSIRELNTNTGAISSQTLMTSSQAIWDFTGGFSYDFGDAPDSYGAATHLVEGAVGSVYLGTTPPDNEPYTLHGGAGGGNGSGDDQAGIDDEDALTVLPDLTVGDSSYELNVRCSGGFVSAWIDLNLNGTFDFVERNGNYPAICQGQNATLTWSGVSVTNAGNSFARIRIANSADEIYKPTGYVDNGEVEDYELRINGSSSSAGNCPAGSVSYVFDSTDVPTPYGGNNSNPVTSTLNIPDSLVITDINVLGVNASHRSQRRLYFLLRHQGTQIQLYGNTCTGNTSFNMDFDDEAASGVACQPANGEVYRPQQSLSAFDGQDAQGLWEMRINSFQRRNTGVLNSWSLEVCAVGQQELVSDIRVGKVVDVIDRIATVNLLIKNAGTAPLTNLQLNDNLDNVFGAGNYQLNSTPQIIAAPAGFIANIAYTGQAGSSLLLASNSSVLQPDEEIQLEFSVEVFYPGTGALETYMNTADVSAVDNAGDTVTDESGTGLDLSTDIDSPTTFSMESVLTISGLVFEDSSFDSQTNHDGVQQPAEAGISGRAVSIVDVATGNQLATAVTAADGSWSASIEPVYAGQPVEVVITPTSTTHFISESPTNVNADVIDGRVIIEPQLNGPANNFVQVGLVKRSTLVLNQAANTVPGSTIEYYHDYAAFTSGNVEFNLSTQNSSQSSSWTETLYHDQNCNNEVDGSDYQINGSLPVNRDESVCMIVSIAVPANSVPGESQQLELAATMYLDDPATTGHGLVFNNRNEDITTVIGTASGNLVLEKSVSNISLGGQPVTQNTALPGHILEYTIAYANTGNGQINDLVINDEAPAYTEVETSSVQCAQTPPVVVCTPNAAGNQLQWLFQGALPAGQGGRVSYRIVVE